MSPTAISDALRNLRLSSYEAKCYLSLLQRNTLTVPEISKLADIHRSSAYDALEKLMSKGMCTARPGRTKKYVACAPASFEEKILKVADETTQVELEKLGNLREEILASNEAAKEGIRDVLRQLQAEYEKSREQSTPLDYIEVMKDPYQTYRRFAQLCAEAGQEILILTKPPFTGSREKLEEQVNQEISILKGGVRGRCIYQIAKDKDEARWQLEIIDRAVRGGEEARVMEELPMKMGIFDERTVIFFLEDPVSGQTSLTAQVVEHRSLAKSLKITFESLWEQARDYRVLKDPRR
jgi:sugar-specific transcriptional regulator TrmB